VLVGDDELNVAMQRYYEEHPGAFQWSLWQQIIGGGLALICCAVLVYSEVNGACSVSDVVCSVSSPTPYALSPTP